MEIMNESNKWVFNYWKEYLITCVIIYICEKIKQNPKKFKKTKKVES